MEKISDYAAYIDYSIFGFLIFLSLLVLAIGIERLWFYSIIRLDDYADRRELELDLHKRLTLIATIGSNAPYVGLLGTVIGIMLTFATIGVNSIIDTKSIMAGLAMALRATALGLIVAIPSIVFYNLLVRKCEVILTNWDIFTNPMPTTKGAKANPRLDSHEDDTANKLIKDSKNMPYKYENFEDLGDKIHREKRIVGKDSIESK
ncbi:TonB-system energizer ExbB [Helicobacter saguini]|uniref:TonB-system energizer ExbB n=1 Tax=Helicobacter saguini TaxID=1548018 RepID=A0A347VPZ5_9HELI|nr:TonB-system energizer ExbB [Helicobacter saguini]MWV68186.1 TonB-system energizer ExbB [Helicobacter saguini]MWV70350.1 TonB-system energizer ExbB [Helicobacter saguini]MWV72252.1 TonB-system energizer ExbB [Helicobacter saguini]TLD95297.1 TonB-system energizer ExbB [Helicobacter saguini]